MELEFGIEVHLYAHTNFSIFVRAQIQMTNISIGLDISIQPLAYFHEWFSVIYIYIRLKYVFISWRSLKVMI